MLTTVIVPIICGVLLGLLFGVSSARGKVNFGNNSSSLKTLLYNQRSKVFEAIVGLFTFVLLVVLSLLAAISTFGESFNVNIFIGQSIPAFGASMAISFCIHLYWLKNQLKTNNESI